MRRSLLHIAWGSVLGFCVAVEAHAATPILVGVLENVAPGDLSPGMATQHVRLAFEYRDHVWQGFGGEYPATVNWTVVFNGRRLGAIQSRASAFPARSGGDFGIESITSAPGKVPQVRTGAARFDYTGSPALTRPLVLVSEPRFNDPEGWKPGSPSDAEKKLAIENFRAKVPSLQRCETPEQQDPPPHEEPYSDNEITVLNAYRSRRGAILVGLQLDPSKSTCEFFDDPTYYNYWFVLSGTSARYLDSQMAPMEAADLAGTGHSVWIFQTSRGEDEDGYELFSDDFTAKTAFSWTYH